MARPSGNIDPQELQPFIAAYCAGDATAGERLCERLLPPVKRNVSRMLGEDAADSDDVVQETLVACLEYVRDERNFAGDPISLAVTIARNRCRDLLRQYKRRPQVAAETLSAWLADPSRSALDDLAEKERRDLVQKTLDGLSTACRRLLRALYLEDLSPEDMKHRTGLGTVHGVYYRRGVCLTKARKLLQNLWRRRSVRRGRPFAEDVIAVGGDDAMMNDTWIDTDELGACLDQDLGAEMWRLALPDCPPEWRVRLETHVKYCAACRLQLAFESYVVDGLRSGELVLTRPIRRPLAFWASGVGAAAMAAGLSLILLSPPSSDRLDAIMRGTDPAAVLSPVPDEVVRGGRPTLRWTPLADATRYDVLVTSVEDSRRWSISTTATEATIPEGEDLAVGSRFRVQVTPVPAYLAPEGLQSSFRTGDAPTWFRYRLRQGSEAGRWLGGLGIASLLLGLGALLPWRRPR